MKIEQERKQEELIWENIDLLYQKLEQGEATEEDIEKTGTISAIIYNVAARNRKRKLSQSNLSGLLRKDMTFFHQELKLETVDFSQYTASESFCL